MPDKQLLIQSFQYGLDTRRSELTSKPGSLVQCNNGHVNQGAQIEKRKEFSRLALPAGTFGCDGTLNGLVVYGSGATPAGLAAWPAFNASWVDGNTVPLSYLQLQAPAAFDTSAMTGVVWSTLFDGLPFVIATFASGNVYVFQATLAGYTLVTDFYAGLVLAGYVSNADQAANLVALINNTTNYTATAVGAVVTITGENGASYAVTDTLSSADGVITEFQSNVATPAQQATAPIGSFTISACNPGTGSTLANVNFVWVNGVTTNIMAAAVTATTSPTSLAAAVAASINAAIATNGGYSALANGNVVSVYAPAGVTANGYALHVGCQNSSNNDGAVCTESCVFTFTLGAGAMTITQVASAQQGTIDSTARASGSFASVQLWLAKVATDIMTLAGQFSAVAVGSQLYISLNGDDSAAPYTDTITITFTASGGAVVTGIPSLSAVAVPSTVGNGQQVTVRVSGGQSPYTYAWTVTNPLIGMSTQNGPTNSFNTTAVGVVTKFGVQNILGTANCVVTDSSGVKLTVGVAINLIPVNPIL